MENLKPRIPSLLGSKMLEGLDPKILGASLKLSYFETLVFLWRHYGIESDSSHRALSTIDSESLSCRTNSGRLDTTHHHPATAADTEEAEADTVDNTCHTTAEHNQVGFRAPCNGTLVTPATISKPPLGVPVLVIWTALYSYLLYHSDISPILPILSYDPA
ncbi:hypothetical protein Tco_0751161 [Tanacetum coccineum]|uniref:Uncharacterized protein n=1 Tax=Tanacetum coccineum TaxID=301880 RepID=A0ABQ4Z488_9ASTR